MICILWAEQSRGNDTRFISPGDVKTAISMSYTKVETECLKEAAKTTAEGRHINWNSTCFHEHAQTYEQQPHTFVLTKDKTENKPISNLTHMF